MSVTSITLTYNEEDTIGDCLNSISWCDEHIVVDGYSSDDTVEVAEAHGADVYQKETPTDANSYEILHQFAVEQASNDWILRIDADERSHQQLNSRLQQLVQKEAADVIMVPRMTFVGDLWVDHGSRWWPDTVPMIFKKGSINITDEVHGALQSISPDADEITLPADEKTAIEHPAYSSIYDLWKKRRRWAKLEAEIIDYPLSHLYEGFSIFLESFIVDKGFTNGRRGFIISVIDGLYNIILVLEYMKIRMLKT